MTCLPTARVFKNWIIGAVLVRLFRNLKRIGSSSLGILRNFHENRNAQGQAVCDFPGPADRVYCSQTVFFVKTAFLRRRAPRNRYPALIVNIGQVGLTGHATCLLTARVLKNWKIGAVLERLLCKLNCIGSSSSTNFMNFRENCNAQGQAVGDFSDSADSVYCSQTFVFAKTAVLPITSPRILYPA